MPCSLRGFQNPVNGCTASRRHCIVKLSSEGSVSSGFWKNRVPRLSWLGALTWKSLEPDFLDVRTTVCPGNDNWRYEYVPLQYTRLRGFQKPVNCKRRYRTSKVVSLPSEKPFTGFSSAGFLHRGLSDPRVPSVQDGFHDCSQGLDRRHGRRRTRRRDGAVLGRVSPSRTHPGHYHGGRLSSSVRSGSTRNYRRGDLSEVRRRKDGHLVMDDVAGLDGNDCIRDSRNDRHVIGAVQGGHASRDG